MLKRVRSEGSVGRIPSIEWLYSIMKDLSKAVELASKFEESLGGKIPCVQRVCNWYLIKFSNTVTLRRFKPLITLTYDRKSNSLSVSSSKSSIRVDVNGFEVRLGSKAIKVLLSELEGDLDLISPLLKEIAPTVDKLLDDLTNCAKASKIH